MPRARALSRFLISTPTFSLSCCFAVARCGIRALVQGAALEFASRWHTKLCCLRALADTVDPCAPCLRPLPAPQVQFLSPRQMLNTSALTTEVVPGATYDVYCYAQSTQGVSDTDAAKKLTWVAPRYAC